MRGKRRQVASAPSELTLHGDLDGAVFLSHVVARRAPVDAGAVHGEVPQGHDLGVLEICGWGRNKKQWFILS